MLTDQYEKFHSEETYYKGQSILFKDEEAEILEIKPVFTIKLIGKNQVLCGNLLRDDICLTVKP